MAVPATCGSKADGHASGTVPSESGRLGRMSSLRLTTTYVASRPPHRSCSTVICAGGTGARARQRAGSAVHLTSLTEPTSRWAQLSMLRRCRPKAHSCGRQAQRPRLCQLAHSASNPRASASRTNSADSVPTDRRIVPPVMPRAARCSVVRPRWLVVSGWLSVVIELAERRAKGNPLRRWDEGIGRRPSAGQLKGDHRAEPAAELLAASACCG